MSVFTTFSILLILTYVSNYIIDTLPVVFYSVNAPKPNQTTEKTPHLPFSIPPQVLG